MNRRILLVGGILAVLAVAILLTLRILGVAAGDEFVDSLLKVLGVIAVLTGASMLVARLAASGSR